MRLFTPLLFFSLLLTAAQANGEVSFIRDSINPQIEEGSIPNIKSEESGESGREVKEVTPKTVVNSPEKESNTQWRNYVPLMEYLDSTQQQELGLDSTQISVLDRILLVKYDSILKTVKTFYEEKSADEAGSSLENMTQKLNNQKQMILIGSGTAALFVSGLIGWLFGRRHKNNSVSIPIQERKDLAIPIEKTPAQKIVQEAPTQESESIPIPVLRSVPKKTEKPKVQEKYLEKEFVQTWRNLTTTFSNALPESKESDIAIVLHELIKGRTGAYSGLNQLLANWEERLNENALTEEEIVNDILKGKNLQILTALHRQNGLTNIPEFLAYLEEHGIPVQAIKDYAQGVFGLLSERVELSFDLPEFGSTFDKNKYDLIDKNMGSVLGVDGGALIRTLTEWQPGNPKPIIDVGVIHVTSNKWKNLITLAAVPTKSSVAYYANTGI